MFENELAMSLANPFVQLANDAVSDGVWSGIGNVRVMNLSRRGVEAQDQLTLVPEPSLRSCSWPAVWERLLPVGRLCSPPPSVDGRPRLRGADAAGSGSSSQSSSSISAAGPACAGSYMPHSSFAGLGGFLPPLALWS